MQSSTQNPQEIHTSHTEREWQKKFFAMGAKCYYCETPLLLKEATKDHRTPLCRGGSNLIRNIVPACLPCNQKKSWKTEAEFTSARPVFSRNPQSRLAINTLKPSPALEVQINEPTLLKKVISERETTSWAWRHPA